MLKSPDADLCMFYITHHMTKTILYISFSFNTVSAINNNKCIHQNINTETKTKHRSGYGVDNHFLPTQTICKTCHTSVLHCQMFYNNCIAFKLCMHKMQMNCQKACFLLITCHYHIIRVTREHNDHSQNGD